MNEEIKMLNKRNATYLNAIIRGINQSEKTNMVSDIKYYKLSFGNQNDQKLDYECTPSFTIEESAIEFKGEQPSDFLSYYWVTFLFDNKTEYKIAMYYKDFDHKSGNIHVLPGLVQILIKCDQDNNIDNFTLGAERSSVISREFGFEEPGDKNGGRAYCEGSWHPCLGNSVLTRDCYTIFKDKNFAECFGREMLIDQEKLHKNEFYSKYCFRSVKASLRHTEELIKEIYPVDKKQKNVKKVSGNGTYKLFKWWDLIEDDAKYFLPLYSIVYIQDERAEGFYCVFGRNQKIIKYKYNDNKTSPNTVSRNPDGNYHWEIKGKVLLN